MALLVAETTAGARPVAQGETEAISIRATELNNALANQQHIKVGGFLRPIRFFVLEVTDYDRLTVRRLYIRCKSSGRTSTPENNTSITYLSEIREERPYGLSPS